MSAVRVVDLVKTFTGRRSLRAPWRSPKRIEALRGVSLEVKAGELVTLLGPNGAGKTTLMKILATLVLPTSGKVEIMGADVVKEGRAARAKVGYVLADERSFFWRLSCAENLRFFASLDGLHGAVAARRVEEVAALVGLSDQLARDFADLSTGQRQRVAIARGLIADPKVVLFDEATRSLDPGRAERIRRVIREILVEREKKAVVFATHDLAEAKYLSDRVVLLAEGRIAAEGPFDAVVGEVRAAFAQEAAQEEAEYRRLFGEAEAR